MHHGDPGKTVEKLMSFSRTEFEAGLRRLAGDGLRTESATRYDLPWGAEGQHLIGVDFEPQPDAVLGGLVKLPRVRVVLHLAMLSANEREEFVTRFDRTFQRGGG